ncbi:MAG TPA: DUF3052 domain-containing protein [Caulobacteraceae bacterium]
MAGETAGYSGKSLAEKLGINAGVKVWLLDASDHYLELLGPLPTGAAVVSDPGEADILHAFMTDRASLAASTARLTDSPRQGAALWISWPKKSSAQFVDLTEDGVREILLPTGWVDVKVCAIDANWSGLKFLRRRI